MLAGAPSAIDLASELRLVHIVDSLDWGGAERLLVTLAEYLEPAEARLTIVELNDSRELEAPYTRELDRLEIPIFRFPGRRLISPGRIRDLAAWLSAQRFDLVHTHLAYANTIGLVCARRGGLPTVASLHANARDTRHPWRQLLEDWSLRRCADRIVAVAESVAEANRARYAPVPVVTIPNVVAVSARPDFGHRVEMRRKLGIGSSATVIVAVARLAAIKAYPDLFAAQRLISQQHPDAQLLVVGDGELREELRSQVATAVPTGGIRLLGARDDVADILDAADVFVSSSRSEGMPLAVLEAMAAGLPVVATTTGDLPQLIGPECGALVAPGSPEAIAAAVVRLLDDPERRRQAGQAARRRVAANARPREWVEKLLALYADVLSDAH